MKIRRLFVIALIMCVFPVAYGQETYFFSQDDISNIRQSAQTTWGKAILDTLKLEVKERLTHSLTVPTVEAGHLHDYFCPVHNVMLDFDWDKPHEHYCSFCDKHWSNDRINWAWLNLLHKENLSFMMSCMYLYIATGEKQYATHIKSMLLDYADKYPAYQLHDKGRTTKDPTNSKMFAQSLDEGVWFSDAGRVYMAIKPILSKKETDKIEKQLFREAADLLLQRQAAGNWQAWNNSGLAALGVVLNDDHIIDVVMNDPKKSYGKMMELTVNKDGWWDENSPNYHFYPLRAMMLTADALRCKGYNLFDTQLEYMLQGPIKGVYSDLSFPSHNDGWYGESLISQVNLYELGYARYKNPLFKDALQACYGKRARNSPEALLTNTEIVAGDQLASSGSYVFAQTGYALLREGKTTAVLKYGPSGGGHGHPDKLSISIHNGEKEILPDFGTCAYGIPDYLSWYKRTHSHSTVVVDSRNQRPTTGQLINFEENSVEAFTDKAYPGVMMRRKLSLENNNIHDVFQCTSDSIHNYDYLLMLAEIPVIAGAFSASELKGDVAYEQIKEVKKAALGNVFVIKTPSAEITIRVHTEGPVEVFTGKASGVPPSNPSVKTPTGSERRPVQPCYPVVIRTKGENMKVEASWRLI